jgi:hypothetical protein
MALHVFTATPWEGRQGKTKTGKCFGDQPDDRHAVALNWAGIQESWTSHLFPSYSEKAISWATSRVPARRRRSAGSLALRRPLRRREDGESTDPGVYIA